MPEPTAALAVLATPLTPPAQRMPAHLPVIDALSVRRNDGSVSPAPHYATRVQFRRHSSARKAVPWPRQSVPTSSTNSRSPYHQVWPAGRTLALLWSLGWSIHLCRSLAVCVTRCLAVFGPEQREGGHGSEQLDAAKDGERSPEAQL